MALIILDRDGVINEDSDDYIKSPDEWVPIPGSIQAIARLNHAGYRVIVVTNQSGVGRGLFDIDVLGKIHEKMCKSLEEAGASIEAIFYCPHTPDDGCNCRKPKPGMFLDIEKRLGKNLNDVYAVGDSMRDIEAAQSAGASPVLVRTGKGMRTLQTVDDRLDRVPTYDDLFTFVDALLNGELASP